MARKVIELEEKDSVRILIGDTEEIICKRKPAAANPAETELEFGIYYLSGLLKWHRLADLPEPSTGSALGDLQMNFEGKSVVKLTFQFLCGIYSANQDCHYYFAARNGSVYAVVTAKRYYPEK